MKITHTPTKIRGQKRCSIKDVPDGWYIGYELEPYRLYQRRGDALYYASEGVAGKLCSDDYFIRHKNNFFPVTTYSSREGYNYARANSKI